MNTQAKRLARGTGFEEEDVLPAATTIPSRDIVLASGRGLNPAYTQSLGIVITSPPFRAKQPVKYFHWTSEIGRTSGHEVLCFEASEEQVGIPGATAVSVAEWPELWRHPERFVAFGTLAGLIAHFQQANPLDWRLFVDAFSLFQALHGSPQQRFQALAREWKRDVAFLSDTNEICTHPAYQQIIGMGTLAVPFILGELQFEPDHWFWALKAITGEDPVPEGERGQLDLMVGAWLSWASQHKARVFVDFASLLSERRDD